MPKYDVAVCRVICATLSILFFTTVASASPITGPSGHLDESEITSPLVWESDLEMQGICRWDYGSNYDATTAYPCDSLLDVFENGTFTRYTLRPERLADIECDTHMQFDFEQYGPLGLIYLSLKAMVVRRIACFEGPQPVTPPGMTPVTPPGMTPVTPPGMTPVTPPEMIPTPEPASLVLFSVGAAWFVARMRRK